MQRSQRDQLKTFNEIRSIDQNVLVQLLIIYSIEVEANLRFSENEFLFEISLVQYAERFIPNYMTEI